MTAPLPPEEDCGFVDIGCKVEGAIDDAITNLSAKVASAAGEAIASATRFWVERPSPTLADTDESGVTTAAHTVGFLQDSLSWYVLAAATMAVIVGGTKMIWERRAQPGKDLLAAMLRLVVVAGCSTGGIALLIAAGDGFSLWMINRSTDGFGEDLAAMVGATPQGGAENAAAEALTTIVVAGLAWLSALLQIVLLVVRNGFLIVLAGVLPLAAAFTNTDTGRQWFSRFTGWLIAYLLYKPAAAIVYSTAFQIVDDNSLGGDPLATKLTGVTLMIMALVALPALLRFTVPAVAAAAAGGGAGGGALAAAAVLMPTGAAKVAASKGGAAASGAAGAAAGGGGGAAGGGPTGGRSSGGGARPTPPTPRPPSGGAGGGGTPPPPGGGNRYMSPARVQGIHQAIKSTTPTGAGDDDDN